jgi:lipid II:glycine glycyltransferase (peptidoglycan interpeptide bridge formation enzyme)
LERVVKVFPDRFSLHLVKDNAKLAAAAICIKINNQILYNFYSAHPKEYDSLSPAVILMKSLNGYCYTNKIDLLDLGTSALEGKPNFGLLDFKMRLGALPTAKYTFQKKLV